MMIPGGAIQSGDAIDYVQKTHLHTLQVGFDEFDDKRELIPQQSPNDSPYGAVQRF